MRRIVLFLFAWLILCVDTSAQEKKPTERIPELSLTAVGRQHHPIQTKSAEAQAYFDQGITLLYGFNHEEAARAFRQAAKLDPDSPMPLWGVAIAAGPNYNLDVDPEREKMAFETVEQAQKLAEHTPQVEKDYVAALAARYSSEANPDYKRLSHDFSIAMKQLSQKYPDDLDAATMYAESLMDLHPWKLWTRDGKPGEDTLEIVRVLESVLLRDPSHAGANHYYIHAVEASPHPERALASAMRLGTMVPQAGHLVHMPAHIYMRTGNYPEAAKSNALAAQVDRVYLQQNQEMGSDYDLLYYCHNLHFLAAAHTMAGRFVDAIKAADELALHIGPMLRKMPMYEFYLPTPIFVLVRFHRWDALLKAAPPDPGMTMTSAFWHFGRGSAAAALGKIEMAEKERKALEEVRATVSLDEEFSMFSNKARTFLDMAAYILDARLAMTRGNSDLAIEYWGKAVAIQDQLNYGEPPEWFYPVRESLGAALLTANKPVEAERIFREDLRQNPRNPRSLFGLMQCLKAQQKEADAAWVERQFKNAWKDADTKLQVSDL